MDENFICSNSEACLHFIYSKFDYYKKILDDDQQACDNMIAFIRQQACLYNNDDEKVRSIIGFDRIELANQLDYFEQEAFKTNEENKTCLFKMFQNLFNLHRECAFDEVLASERQITESFKYRPSVLFNIEKIHFPINSIISSLSTHSDIKHSEKNHLTFAATPTPQTSLPTPIRSTTFSNRADIEAFQQKKNSIPSKTMQITKSPIDSNEIDLTQLIRETYPNNTSDQFKFSKISHNWRQQQKSSVIQSEKISQRSIQCNDALLIGANKRFVLLYNMNIQNILYIFDTQKNEPKEIQWEEGDILSLGHVDSNLFYIITSTKIFLYDIIKEHITTQYFLYDTLYKDLLLIMDDSYYQTILKRNNQIQSTVYDDYCYYLYTNKEYNQIFIKCLLDNFFQEKNINLTKLYPDIQYFIGFTVTPKSLITFLINDSNMFQLLVCDENQNYNIIKKIPMNNLIDPTKIISTFLPKIKVYPSTTNKNKTIKYGKQLWFILDTKRNCIDCVTHEIYVTKIEPSKNNQIQSISIFDDKLILAYNELSVEIIDLDNYCSLFQL
ncbi:unnamed protein product [Rotaria sordida]|uniref:Uncharacterized protein n=1 Tax=Rotaria sordida TaxID=392033 RepID=A0A813SH33_9BILA|nr:unnamed protein product [Rotaria sordida]CAF0800487.1 unnamed protein product [Rotaria sordida]CAF0843753.1 unnamed protein product [Rotaria sordida]CAF0912569.1 unnamed protein product [Rotaria sordida]CAF0914362.1 unnamed protein product [Rotaria sordida]